MSALACFTFDNMGEVRRHRRRPGARIVYAPSITTGYPNLFDLLERHGVRATFFVEGWNGDHHPELVAEIPRRGHELGMHGWLHEAWGDLDAATEAALARRATEALERAAEVRPRGFRAPGGRRSASTEQLLLDLGYHYDASLGDGMRLGRLPAGLAQIPFVWPAVDGYHYLRPEPVDPDSVRDTWLAALDKAATTGGLFLLICHAFITGTDRRRLEALDEVLAAAVADRRLAVVTAAEAAARVAP